MPCRVVPNAAIRFGEDDSNNWSDAERLFRGARRAE